MSGQKTHKTEIKQPRPFIAGVPEERDPFWIARRVRITENGICNEVVLSHSGKILGWFLLMLLGSVIVALQSIHMNAEHHRALDAIVESEK